MNYDNYFRKYKSADSIRSEMFSILDFLSTTKLKSLIQSKFVVLDVSKSLTNIAYQFLW